MHHDDGEVLRSVTAYLRTLLQARGRRPLPSAPCRRSCASRRRPARALVHAPRAHALRAYNALHRLPAHLRNGPPTSHTHTRVRLQVGGGAALSWPGVPDFLPALLAAVQRLLQPQLEDRACSLVGALILELLRHAGPQMVSLRLTWR